MSVFMDKNPMEPGASNTLRPTDRAFKFYKKQYTSGTTQEWIYLPDIQGASITIVPTGGAAQMEITNDPPDIIEAGTAVAVISGTLGSSASTATGVIAGPTAVRVNMTAATSCYVIVRV